MIILHAKSEGALRSAAAKRVAQLQDTPGAPAVLVVYADLAARVFCEQFASKSKLGLAR